jgi:large subunit ribosomal protein L4
MMKKVFSIDGSELRQIKLNDKVFNIEINEGSIYEAIKNELANCRAGTASTKSRSEVATRKGARSTSRRKPWRQKGTGRARAGRKGSPIWVGGGIAFGPKSRNFHYRINKKVKRLAIKSILTIKNKNDNIIILEDFNLESGKTKELMKILNHFIKEERTVFIISDASTLLKRAGSNIPWLNFLSYNRLRAHDIFYGKKLLILESAAKGLNKFYSRNEER